MSSERLQCSVSLPRVFVVESHDVHHFVLDVPHEVRAARDCDLLRKKRESAENVSSQIRLKVIASSLLTLKLNLES